MFAPLPLARIELLAAETEPRQFPAGGVLIREGEPGDLRETRAPYQEAMNSLGSHAADSRVQRTSRPPRPPIPSCCQPPALTSFSP